MNPISITKLLVLLLFFCLPSFASDYRGVVALTWEPSPSANVTDYKVYWGGASRQYTNYNLVNATTRTNEVANLMIGRTYYFAASAVDSVNGLESEYSNEVSTNFPSIPGVPDNLMIGAIMQWWDGTNWNTVIPPVPPTNPPVPPPVVICNVSRDGNTKTNTDYTSIFGASMLWASPVLATADYTNCAIRVPLSRTAGILGNLYASVWSQGANGLPKDKLGESMLVDIFGLSANKSMVTFDWLNVPIVSGTKYWVVLRGNDVVKASPSDVVQWWRNNSTNGVYYQTTSGSWARSTGNKWGVFELLSKP